MMRFLADENVSRLVVERIRAAGFEVISVGATRSAASDREVLAIAANEDCFLVTEDRDFGELVIRQRLGVRGVILLELDRLSNAAEAERAVAIIAAQAAKLSGNLVVIEPARVRFRPLAR